MFDPIQSPGPERSQRLQVIGKEHQADWKHPQSGDWQKPKKASDREQ